MKKNINIFVVLVISLFVGIIGVNAKSTNNIYYVNDNGVSFTKEEYDFFTKMYYDGYQAYMTLDDYHYYDNVEKKATKVERVEYDESKVYHTRGTSHETNAKKLTISKTGSTYPIITINCVWKTNPAVRSYDLIGAYLSGTSVVGGVNSRIVYSGGTIYPSATQSTSNGEGASILLPSSGTSIVASSTFSVYQGGIVYGSYQHAKQSVTLNQSNSYTFSYAGLGGVFNFSNSTIRDKYDKMSGVYIQV